MEVNFKVLYKTERFISKGRVVRNMESHPRDATYSVLKNRLEKYDALEKLNNRYQKKVSFGKGYQVGIVEGTYMKIHTSHKSFKEENIMTAVLECVNKKQSHFVGVWTDEDGVAHIDPCEYIHHRTNAVEMAERNNQLSIWDSANMKEIVKADWYLKS